MFPIGKSKWIFLLLLLCLEPVYELLMRLYRSVFDVLKGALLFFEASPLVTLMALVIVYLLFSKNR